MHVTDLCPKWLLNGEWAANRETRMCKHKEGDSCSQRVTLPRRHTYTRETTVFQPRVREKRAVWAAERPTGGTESAAGRCLLLAFVPIRADATLALSVLRSCFTLDFTVFLIYSCRFKPQFYRVYALQTQLIKQVAIYCFYQPSLQRRAARCCHQNLF